MCAVNTVGRWPLATNRLYGTHGEEFRLRAPQLFQTTAKPRNQRILFLLPCCARMRDLRQKF